MHWDLRLEIDGVLCSWAVPKEPSMDPDDKRLAVKVENHPLEYVHFEAVIPTGNYGAGPMIAWDRGLFRPLIDPAQGLLDGEIKFELYGYKLRGAFTLVHTGKGKRGQQLGSRQQRLAADQEARRAAAQFLAAKSRSRRRVVLSGLTIDELADRRAAPSAACSPSSRAAKAAEARDRAGLVEPMLCQTADARVLVGRLDLRAQVRRLPHARARRRGPGDAALPLGPRPDGSLSRAHERGPRAADSRARARRRGRDARRRGQAGLSQAVVPRPDASRRPRSSARRWPHR